MGKVKVKKKDARIDMTAMSDVTVLLLIFFLLTSTFLQKEPVTVITPESVSEDKVPDSKLMTVLVSPKGQVYMELIGTVDTTVMSSENLRKNALGKMCEKYNVKLTAKEVKDFSKMNSFGVPMKNLKQWLDLNSDDRDKALKEGPGIPVAMTEYNGKTTEFQDWVKAVSEVMESAGEAQDIRDGKGIAIKADATTPYRMVELVMNNLQSINRNKFTLMTALKKEEEK